MPTSTAQRRIARLASLTAVHRAFHWLHLHQPQLRQWQLELVRIPAPPFAEHDRAAWFLERFRQLGLTNIHLDEEGNALAELTPDPQNPPPTPPPASSSPPTSTPSSPPELPANPSKTPTPHASSPPASATTPPASPPCSPSPPPSATPTSSPPSPSSSPPT